MLKRVLDTLVDFQWTDTANSPYPQDKPFDQTVLLWESSYFMERCVYRIFDLKEFCRSREEALTREFEQLGKSVSSLPRQLMHRDFQSENVMIVRGKPWFIDFQAAHHGPCFYDAASMIGDPYLDLPRRLRSELEQYYLTNVGSRLNMTLDESKNALVLCGIQRHMQALGAYGFISSIREKSEFLEFIPPALQLLSEEVSRVETQFPVLNELVDKLLSSTVLQAGAQDV
jgi:aminoglycoside/choline kinase family phosphotransferase